MKDSTKTMTTTPNPERQLKELLAGYEPDARSLILSVRNALRKRLSSENELVYNYPRGLVISWSPTERGSDAVVAISAGTDGLRLVFNNGPQLPDPKGLLLGSGRQTRFIWIESEKKLAHPDVKALLDTAKVRARKPALPGAGREVIFKKSSSGKRQRQKSKR
jgi:hypothetical protein